LSRLGRVMVWRRRLAGPRHPGHPHPPDPSARAPVPRRLNAQRPRRPVSGGPIEASANISTISGDTRRPMRRTNRSLASSMRRLPTRYPRPASSPWPPTSGARPHRRLAGPGRRPGPGVAAERVSRPRRSSGWLSKVASRAVVRFSTVTGRSCDQPQSVACAGRSSCTCPMAPGAVTGTTSAVVLQSCSASDESQWWQESPIALCGCLLVLPPSRWEVRRRRHHDRPSLDQSTRK
jgi:hypothetical protein